MAAVSKVPPDLPKQDGDVVMEVTTLIDTTSKETQVKKSKMDKKASPKKVDQAIVLPEKVSQKFTTNIIIFLRFLNGSPRKSILPPY
jgi:hypothetical protein